MLRVALYRLLLRYRIARGARVGIGTLIAVDKARIGRARIGRRNTFSGPFTLCIGEGAEIGPENLISCGYWAAAAEFGEAGYERSCTLEADSRITSGHFIDAVGGFSLGAGSWIAGRGSQFWTHGVGVRDRQVSIGARCYIGSAVRFAPGAAVADESVVAIGSVVTKKFADRRVLVAGVPASVVREDYESPLAEHDDDQTR
jgi:acetyltransferase-like isoleucine patch superfamily enzyme